MMNRKKNIELPQRQWFSSLTAEIPERLKNQSNNLQVEVAI